MISALVLFFFVISRFYKNLSFVQTYSTINENKKMQSTDRSPTSHYEGPGGVETIGMYEKKFTPTDGLRKEVDSPSSTFSNPKPPVNLLTVRRMIPDGIVPASYKDETLDKVLDVMEIIIKLVFV